MKALLIIALILSSSFAKVQKATLQSLRSEYKPKMPSSIEGAAKLVEGKKTESVADQAEIKKLFPNTYGMPIITFEKSNLAQEGKPINVGVILSGGQAPGGHNVISGIFNGIKKLIKIHVYMGS